MKQINKKLDSIKELVDFIKNEEFVFIQTHDFPDHDAIASAFGLQYFFSSLGIKSKLVYEGTIQRDSLKKFINDLQIDVRHISECKMAKKDKVILVDGAKGMKNMTDLPGDEIAVIDHHQNQESADVEFHDIRPSYGACSTVIASYFKDFEIEIPANLATAFLIGINFDTQQLTRGVSPKDLEVYFDCYQNGDIDYVTGVLRNNITLNDLKYFRYLIDNLECYDRLGFCFFHQGCSQNLLGLLGDFVLSLSEIDFVVLCAKNDERINFSLRSEIPSWNAAKIIQQLLQGIGFGGGHAEMAGAVVPDASRFNKPDFIANCQKLLN